MQKNNRIFIKWNGFTQTGYFKTVEDAKSQIKENDIFFNNQGIYTIHNLDNSKITLITQKLLY